LNQHSPLLSDAKLGFREAYSGSLDAGATDDDSPLRAELFSAQQMAAHGKTLAATHVLSNRGGPDRLLARLAENAEVISQTCDELTTAVKAARQITPASEWLLDNSYLIEEQIRIARRPARRACIRSRWKSSPTATAASIRKACAALSTPTRKWPR
jgi:hypothetical protein